MEKKKPDNFVECHNALDANRVSLDHYTFLERLSAARNCYCFKIRERKKLV